MRVSEPIDELGYFWLPSTPDKRFPGQLTIRDGGEILIRAFYDGENRSPLVVSDEENFRLHGQIGHYGHVTLENCWISFGGRKIAKTHTYGYDRIYPSQMYTRVLYDENEDIHLTQLNVVVENLEAWGGVHGFQPTLTFPPTEKTTRKSTLTLDRIEPARIVLRNGYIIEIDDVFTTSNTPNTHRVCIRFISETAKPASDFIFLMHKVLIFLCISTNCITSPIKITYQTTQDGNVTEGSVFFPSIVFSTENSQKPRSRHEILFSFSDLMENDAEVIFERWLEIWGYAEPSLVLYLKLITNHYTLLSSKFLTVVQILESYHRQIRQPHQNLSAQPLKNREVVLKSCPEDLREWLKTKLKFVGEPRLRARLNDVTTPFQDYFTNSKARKRFIQATIDHRNYLTHYDTTSPIASQPFAKQVQVHAEMYPIWTLLFRLNILLDLGLPPETVKQMVENSIVDRQVLRLLSSIKP